MPDPISAAISTLALLVSAATAWFTLLRGGTVRMTQPAVIYFGPDGKRNARDERLPKIYLRTLLYSTSKRGRVIEAMYATLRRNESRQTFNIWVHGNKDLVRGSGLFVSDTGVAENHHFLTPKDGSNFEFKEGTYELEVHAKLVGDSKSIRLWTQHLVVNAIEATNLGQERCGLYFDWGPASGQYIAHIEASPPDVAPEELVSMLASSFGSSSNKPLG
jgi:hypothetical protein